MPRIVSFFFSVENGKLFAKMLKYRKLHGIFNHSRIVLIATSVCMRERNENMYVKDLLACRMIALKIDRRKPNQCKRKKKKEITKRNVNEQLNDQNQN